MVLYILLSQKDIFAFAKVYFVLSVCFLAFSNFSFVRLFCCFRQVVPFAYIYHIVPMYICQHYFLKICTFCTKLYMYNFVHTTYGPFRERNAPYVVFTSHLTITAYFPIRKSLPLLRHPALRLHICRAKGLCRQTEAVQCQPA